MIGLMFNMSHLFLTFISFLFIYYFHTFLTNNESGCKMVVNWMRPEPCNKIGLYY